jgi:hypothetical protein
MEMEQSPPSLSVYSWKESVMIWDGMGLKWRKGDMDGGLGKAE